MVKRKFHNIPKLLLQPVCEPYCLSICGPKSAHPVLVISSAQLRRKGQSFYFITPITSLFKNPNEYNAQPA